MRFCLGFLFFSGFFSVLFWLWVLGAVLLLFPSGFLCAFLFVFSLLFGLFLGSFLALGAGRRAALFSVWLFVCVFVCVFSSFRAFLGFWRPRGGEGQRLMTADWGLITAAGEAYDSGRGADYRGGKGF